MNRRGQALVEFVLVLPVILMILFVIVDFGVIFSEKNKLESDSVDIALMIKNKEDISTIKATYKDIDIDVSTDDKYINIIIKKEVNLITPGLNRILDDPYEIKVKKVIYNET